MTQTGLFELICSYLLHVIAFLGGGWSFLVFFICMCGQLLWVLKIMPETKGIPLAEMSDLLSVE
ncbi:MFS transporter [uncultured Mobiluncus sp.]|uniref:MFS transporter n=1 Tax=uncultured Mobiluncus sp. TaxID=293425 RepID=UPI002602DA6A|nr:MFS transporter [uncultured Mobiluncus sp.]